MCICDYVKDRIGTCKRYVFFSLKKGISRLAGWVAQENTAVAQKHNMKGYTIEDKTLATQQNCDSIYS